MKTKIIYISGSEVFDMADIRTAFDTVRNTLSLDNDTVLFGVPIDSDDAFASQSVSITPDVQITEDISKTVVDKPTQSIKNEDISVSHDETVAESQVDIPVTKPKKAKSRAKVVPISSETGIADESTIAPDESNKPDTIPILSVLGVTDSKSETASQEPVTETESEQDSTPIDIKPVAPAPIDVVTDSDESIKASDTQHVSIGDMLADDATPVAEHEKTLEELLESMTPLGEDEKIATQSIEIPENKTDTDKSEKTDNDTDVTLELLAAEFAESADKIVPPAKPETRGKIGKLKNILPFKKAKRDDSGIMGDLFGWAGVANDEDFTIPGFFANATKK